MFLISLKLIEMFYNIIKIKMTNLRAIRVKYLPATNTKSSRVKIEDLRAKRFGTTMQVVLSYDHSKNNAFEQAVDYLQSKGFNLV